jgi:LCP family protein required for cell wall assembly
VRDPLNRWVEGDPYDTAGAGYDGFAVFQSGSPDRAATGAGPDPADALAPWPGSDDEDSGHGNASRYGPRGSRARRPKRRRPLRRTAIALLTVVLGTSLGTYAWADTKLDRDVDLNTFGIRPPAGEGTNYLIVGSDSREGLSEQDRKELHTGSPGGRRTDSMIVLHTGAHGTTMVSLPRDSWITIPGYISPATGKRSAPTQDKLNATFAYGGPQLLSRTVEHNTGLRIDHYAEIGFAGFVNIVNAVGGVPICLDRDIKDEKSGSDLRKGCQVLDGTEALAFVRQRHQEAQGDLGRTRNQRKFLSALAHRAAAPDTALNPFELYPALSAGLDTLIVDRGMTLRDLMSMFRAVQSVTGGRGRQINVPVADPFFSTPKGSAVRWNTAQARKLFGELKHDRPVSLTEKGSAGRSFAHHAAE